MLLPCPQPVYPPDLPMAELRTPELLPVASTRLWVASLREPEAGHPAWQGGLEAAGIARMGAPALEALLRIVATAAQRSLDVRCMRCARLGADEAALLHILSLLQGGRQVEALAILADWLPCAAARLALAPAEGFARAMARGGLDLPLRHAEAATIHRLAPTAHADRGLAMVQ